LIPPEGEEKKKEKYKMNFKKIKINNKLLFGIFLFKKRYFTKIF